MNRVALAALIAVACSSSSAPRQQALEHQALEHLSLHIGPGAIVPGEKSSFDLTLQNEGDRPLSLCMIDSGVSIWMRMPSTGQMVPVQMFGTTTDTACPRRISIPAHEVQIFHQEPVFPKDWVGSAAEITVGALVRVTLATNHNSMGDPATTIRTEGRFHVAGS